MPRRDRAIDAARKIAALAQLATCSRAEVAESAGVHERTIFKWQQQLRLGVLVAPDDVVATLLVVADAERRSRRLVEIIKLIVKAQAQAGRLRSGRGAQPASSIASRDVPDPFSHLPADLMRRAAAVSQEMLAKIE